MKILVSACLLGIDCKYNGKNNKNDKIIELLKDHELIPVCPEILGGLPTPRIPAEIHQQSYRKRWQRCYKTIPKRCRRDTKNCKVI